MATGKYAVISIVRKQVADFTDRPQMFNQQYNWLVDLDNHPQKDEVDIDWFYNQDTNTFSQEEDEEIELLSFLVEDVTEEDEQLSEDEKMLLIMSVNSDYLSSLAELNV